MHNFSLPTKFVSLLLSLCDLQLLLHKLSLFQSSTWELYMGVRRDTWVLWFRSPIYQAVGHCVLPAPVACRCLL